MDALAATYYGGDWSKAEKEFEAALSSCYKYIDTEHNYYLVEFVSSVGSTTVASGSGGGVQPQIIHFLAHAGQSDFRLVVPGLGPSTPSAAQCTGTASADGLLIEVFLSAVKEATLATTANEVRTPSVLAANVGAFFQQINGGPFWPLTAAAALGPVKPPPIYARMGCVSVLNDNGPISLSELATIAHPTVTTADRDKMQDPIKSVHDKYTSLGSELDPCAAKVNETLFNSLPVAANTNWEMIPTQVRATVKSVTSTAPCAGASAPGFQQTEAIAEDYIAAMGGSSPAQVTGSATVVNAAKVRFRFSAVVGGLVGRGNGAQPLTVNSSGNYAGHPLSRGLTMAAIAWYAVPFDSTAPSMATAERFSVIGGPVLTPAGGFGLGGALTLFRGFAVSGGHSWLLVATGVSRLRSGDAAPTTGRQFATGVLGSWFVAGSYVFGK